MPLENGHISENDANFEISFTLGSALSGTSFVSYHCKIMRSVDLVHVRFFSPDSHINVTATTLR